MSKKLIISSLLLSTSLFVSIPHQADASFKDVQLNTEQGQAIQSLVDRHIVSGYQDGTFRPGELVTRKQIAKILAGALNLDTENVTNPNFSDVPTTHPNYKYIAALANAGIVSGSNGKFNPEQPVTRGQVAKILSNAYQLKSDDYELPFKDVDGSGFEQYIRDLYVFGITNGINESTYGVYQPVTRGQLALFIKRLEDTCPKGTAIFLSKDYGINHYYDANLYTLTGESPTVELYSSYYYQNKELNRIEPKKPGTTYLNLVEYEEGTLEYDTVVTLKIDVTEGKNGLETKVTKLDTPIYPPQPFYFDELPEKIVITDMNHHVVDPKFYPLYKETVYDEDVTYYGFLGDEGNYLLNVVDENGEVTNTYAFTHKKDFNIIGIECGLYAEGNTLQLSKEFINSRGYEYDHVEYESNNGNSVIEVETNANGVSLKINGEDEGTLLFYQGEMFLGDSIQIKKFGDGYLVLF